MTQLSSIQFFQLKKVRTKKFAKKLKRLFKEKTNIIETIDEKQKRIKEKAALINQKLKTA